MYNTSTLTKAQSNSTILKLLIQYLGLEIPNLAIYYIYSFRWGAVFSCFNQCHSHVFKLIIKIQHSQYQKTIWTRYKNIFQNDNSRNGSRKYQKVNKQADVCTLIIAMQSLVLLTYNLGYSPCHSYPLAITIPLPYITINKMYH